MQELFFELVKLSLTGSLFAAAVMLVRLVFRKAPRWLFCVLWGVVALRLICPVSIESDYSLIPDRLASGQIITNVGSSYIGEVNILYENNAGYSNAVEAGRQPVYSNDGYYVVTEKDSFEEPKTVGKTIYPVLSWIWMAGMVLMVGYIAVSYLLLRRKMEEATLLRDNIWQCEQADSPFVLGFIKPRIYLPYAIADSDMANVIAHEQAHIQRKDHWWKPFGFLLLSVHWFNPVLWVSYILLCRDIEAACDEKVIKHMGRNEMRAYSTALLNCSVHRRRIAACPLAFGEVGVKERIKRVMNYKKPAFWIILLALVASVVACVLLLTNPVTENTTLVGANYRVTEVLYSTSDQDDDRYSRFLITDEYEFYAQLQGRDTWNVHEKMEFCPFTAKELKEYTAQKSGLVSSYHIGEITDAYICRVENDYFYLAAQTKNGDTLIGFGWEDVSERGQIGSDDTYLRYLYKVEVEEDVEAEEAENDKNAHLLDLIQQIVDNPDCAASSNPFTFIDASKKQYNEILTYGSAAVDCFVEQLRTGENGLQGYIMAVACADITGIGDKYNGADWAMAQQWLALYDKSEKSVIIPPVIATDYISGKQARLRSFGYTSTGEIACGFVPWQGHYGEENTLVLDGMYGQNQILLAPQGFSIRHYNIYLPDGTLYDDGTRMPFDSLSPRVMGSEKGICLITPFQSGEFIYEIEVIWPEQDLVVTYGLKIVMTGEENEYDRALHSVFEAYGEGNALIAVSLVDKYVIGNAVSHSPRYVFKVENVPNAPIFVEVSQVTGEIIGEVESRENWLVDPPYVEGQTNVSDNSDGARQMTLSDVIELSKLGMELTWEDLKVYKGKDIGSGLHVVKFEIDAEFYLLVGDGKFTGKPMYAYLNAISTGTSCDIRECDAESFIKENQSDALDYPIYKAIIEHNADGTFPDFPNGLIPTEIHYIFGVESKSGTPSVGQINQMEETTVYVQYVYRRYSYSNGELTKASGNDSLAKITFSVDPEIGYTLKEFWEPNGGSVYAEEIRNNFPKEIADIVLDPQNDIVDMKNMEQACLIKVQEYISSLTDQ